MVNQIIYLNQKTVKDTSRWIHPHKPKDTGTALGKGETQPALGWTDTPGPKAGKGASIAYSAGSTADYKSAPPKGYKRSDSAATTNPDITNPDWYQWRAGQIEAGFAQGLDDFTNPNWWE